MMAKPRLNWTAEPWDDSESLECTMIVPEAPNWAVRPLPSTSSVTDVVVPLASAI